MAPRGNIYWKDALSSGLTLKVTNTLIYCGEEVCFWHGNESTTAQTQLLNLADFQKKELEYEQANKKPLTSNHGSRMSKE